VIATLSAMAAAASRVRLTEKETVALGALRQKPGRMSPLNVGVALAGDHDREARRDTLIRSGNQVLSALARHALVARIQPRTLGWPIYKITDEGCLALDTHSRADRGRPVPSKSVSRAD
jgi:hypothetical protein